MDLTGIGPTGAARLLSDVGDIHRFRNKDRFASWNGTAPLDASSGAQQRHRLSRAGNRRINRTLHIMAVVQLRNHTLGRAFYDARKAGGTPSLMAMRAPNAACPTSCTPACSPTRACATTLQGRVPPGQRLCHQRDRLAALHRLFGQATSRTRQHPA
jgi:hypothetical protein